MKLVSIIFGLIIGLSILAKEHNFTLRMKTPLATSLPCFSSLMSQVQSSGSCALWEPNLISEPSFDPSRLYIFVGGADQFLYVVDYLNGKVIKRITTNGRVITRTLIDENQGKIFFASEKGILTSLDAYNFSPHFSFKADAKINNDLILHKDSIIFSTILGTVYSINTHTGKANWTAFRPFKDERLRMAQNSNLLVIEQFLVAPHPDGFLSVISLDSGSIKRTIDLALFKDKGFFPDIVAPLVIEQNTLWVSSYSEGIFFVDVKTWRLSKPSTLKEIKEIVQLKSIQKKIYMASANKLFASDSFGNILWSNDLSKYYTEIPKFNYPFNHHNAKPNRFFKGRPSNLVSIDGGLLMATDKGGIGIFEKNTGRLLMVLGSGIGLSPYILQLEKGIVGVSLGGNLYHFSF